MLDTTEPATIKCSLCTVSTLSGDVVGIESTAGLCRVKALHCRSRVRILIGERQVNLAPGQEILVADHAPPSAKQRPADGVGRRACLLHRLESKISLVSFDVSIVTMLDSAAYLRDLRKQSSAGYTMPAPHSIYTYSSAGLEISPAIIMHDCIHNAPQISAATKPDTCRHA